MISKIKDLDKIKEKGLDSLYPDKVKISVGMSTCGLASGAQEVFDTLETEIKNNSLDYIVTKTGCLGFCQEEPIIDIYIPGQPHLTLKKMNPLKAQSVLSGIKDLELRKDQMLCKFDKDIFIDEDFKDFKVSAKDSKFAEVTSSTDHHFFSRQKKIVLRNCGIINPDSIEEYIGRNGYYAAAEALNNSKPEDIIKEVKDAGIRGRGGAGFSTGMKWEFCRKAEGTEKYIICNADEGDPGAYMDRSVLEGDPHTIIEGMIIGGYAIGANKGYIYVRAEYPLAIIRLNLAIEQARANGILGKNIFDSGFDFDLEIFKGAGAFVCGEETALIASIEGEIGNPRSRPPYPANSGLWGKPTNINNVETWANIPVIIQKGAKWFSGIGTNKSKGTKVFSLVGKVRNSGLVEVPMGITLSEIVNEVGGGTLKNRKLKAVQTGGPSGGCIPESFMHLPIDFDELIQAGAIMGSGGLIVMDDRTCMVDVARYFTEFLVGESCGKCTPCREGVRHMFDILTDICEGKGDEKSIPTLERLAKGIKSASLCALGGTAPNPVLSTLKYFKHEYEMHIKEKKCAAGICKPLTKFIITTEACTKCGICSRDCPTGALSAAKKELPVFSYDKCTVCGICIDNCPSNAIMVDL